MMLPLAASMVVLRPILAGFYQKDGKSGILRQRSLLQHTRRSLLDFYQRRRVRGAMSDYFPPVSRAVKQQPQIPVSSIAAIFSLGFAKKATAPSVLAVWVSLTSA